MLNEHADECAVKQGREGRGGSHKGRAVSHAARSEEETVICHVRLLCELLQRKQDEGGGMGGRGRERENRREGGLDGKEQKERTVNDALSGVSRSKNSSSGLVWPRAS